MLLTQLPDELPAGFDRSRTYDTRGWTTFERCSAELGTKPSTLGFAKWKLVIDVASGDGGAQRRLPVTPERMAKLLAACRFTNGADSAAVLKLYETTATKVLAGIEKLKAEGIPLAEAAIADLGNTMEAALEKLDGEQVEKLQKAVGNAAAAGLAHFDKVWESDPNHRKAPIARYRAALVTEVFMNDLQAAYVRYEGFLKAYPDHEFAESAELQLKYVGDPDGLLDAVLEEAGQGTEAPE